MINISDTKDILLCRRKLALYFILYIHALISSFSLKIMYVYPLNTTYRTMKNTTVLPGQLASRSTFSFQLTLS